MALNHYDQIILENLFHMGDGRVTEFSNRTFEEFFEKDLGVSIYDKKYFFKSDSKANRLRCFWKKSDDKTIIKSIEKIILDIEFHLKHSGWDKNKYTQELIDSGKAVCRRLGGDLNDGHLLDKDSDIKNILTNIKKLELHISLEKCIEKRVCDSFECYKINVYLPVVVLCGSIVEGVLLHVAAQNNFSGVDKAPKESIEKWSLHDLIRIAKETKFLPAHNYYVTESMREYRNFIHPAKEASFPSPIDKEQASYALHALNLIIKDISSVA